MSLKRQMNISLLLIAILPILLTSAIQLVTINYWSDDLIEKNLINSSQSFKAIIEDFFTQQSIDMSIVSHMPEVKELLQHPTELGMKEVEDIFKERVSDKYYIDFYLLYNADAKLVTTTNKALVSRYPSLPEDVGNLIPSQVWFSDYLQHPIYPEQSGVMLAVTPIIIQGKTIGYFGAGFNNTYLSRIIENVNLKNKIKVRLEDKRGHVVSTLGLFVLQAGQINNFDQVVSTIDFEANPTGMITYDNYHYEEIAYYTPIEGTPLRLYTALNMLDYQYPIHTIYTNMFIVFLVVSIIVGLIMTRVAYYINTYMEKTLDTMIQIKNGDFKARLSIAGKGEIRYIADTFNDLLATIEHNNDELYRSSERYRIAVRTFSDVFFELNIIEDLIEFGSGKWTTMYHLDQLQTYSSVFQWFYDDLVYGEDKEKFYLAMERNALLDHFRMMEEGQLPSVTLDFRWNHPHGAQWVSMTLVPMYDKNGAMKSMVGYLKNIHDQKSKEMTLMMQAQQDGLTKISNKVTTQRLIEELLEDADGNSNHALLIVDLDDFKQVNDSYGHLVGDDVLRDVSELLRSLFRSSDVVGRIGGDEFLIFMQDVSRDVVTKKANEIVSRLANLHHLPFEIHISCSIGIAMYPFDGGGFFELFEHADKALYEAKEAGKNQFNFK